MKIFPFLLITGSLVASAIPDEKPIDVILVAGQSNAVGFDAKPSELPENPADKTVMFWFRCGDPPPDKHDTTSGGEAWTFLKPQPLGNPAPRKPNERQYGNFAQQEGGFGPEMGMTRLLKKEQPDRKLAVIKAAFSGTGVRKDWNPNDETGPSGSCYRALIAETGAALAAAQAEGKTMRLRALVWIQGESDANAADLPHYEKALGEMIAAVRRDLATPELKVLIAVNTKFGGGKKPEMPLIVDAQKAVAAADPNCIYVDTSAATIANNAHYDTKGTLDVGQWFGEALLKLENEKGDR